MSLETICEPTYSDRPPPSGRWTKGRRIRRGVAPTCGSEGIREKWRLAVIENRPVVTPSQRMKEHNLGFLIGLATLPAACTEQPPSTAPEGSTGSPATDSETTAGAEQPTSDDEMTTSAGADESSDDAGGSTTVSGADSSGTTGGSSAQEPCELYVSNSFECYGIEDSRYYDYYVSLCFELVDAYSCRSEALELIACFGNTECSDSKQLEQLQEELEAACGEEWLAVRTCESEAFGCDMIASPSAAGTIAEICTDFATTVGQCIQEGYVPSDLSYTHYNQFGPMGLASICQGTNYALDYTIIFGFHTAPLEEPACGGAYEELMACISGLSCGELTQALAREGGICQAEYDAVRCRCELEVEPSSPSR